MWVWNKDWAAPALAGGLVALVALAGCGGQSSVASRSAAAFQEALEKGETFAGGGHAHGGAEAGGGHDHAAHGGAPLPGEAGEGGAAAASAHDGHGHAGEGHAGHRTPAAAAAPHAGHDHAGRAHPRETAPPAGGAHAGHAGQSGHEGHSSHAVPHAEGHAAPAPASSSPGEPAATLRSDAFDAPAASSVEDARRSAEIAAGMAGHAHGAPYRHVDAGREPARSEKGTEAPHAHPPAHGAAPNPAGHEHGQEEKKAALYVCPMHPEVTSKTPGTCPKCGMKLVERRQG